MLQTDTTINTLKYNAVVPPDLEARFGELKKKIIDPKNHVAVKESWKRLLVALKKSNQEIIAAGSSCIPTVQWSEIVSNDNRLPNEQARLFQERGAIMVKGVIPTDQIDSWFSDLESFCKEHPETSGYTYPNPASWYNVFWTKPQTEARSHPNICQMMKTFGSQFYVEDEETLIDLSSQIVYGDRIRIRQPGAVATLKTHLDSGSIERWEDDNYRHVYKEIFEGNWEVWDPFKLDSRVYAHEDLYPDGTHRATVCSSFRTLQGWLALSDNKTGEGTLRVLPSLKTTMAYIMLRPFFWEDPASGLLDDYELDVESPKFPGAVPSLGQLFISPEYYRHLELETAVVGIPDVHRGDFILWHADVAHEVDREHNGSSHSSVFYYGQTPLCLTNIKTLLDTKESFEKNCSPADFYTQLSEEDKAKEDQGADVRDISGAGLEAMGLKPFDVNEPGLTSGQRKIREIANRAVFEGKFDAAPFHKKF